MNRTVLGVFATVLLACSSGSATAEDLNVDRDCVLGPHVVVDVSSAVPGLLEVVAVERSDAVHAGQVLARLESGVEHASRALADAWASIDSEVRIEETTRALDRRRNQRISQLFASNAVALDDKDQAETDVALAALRLRQAHEKRWIRELDARKAEATVERRTVRSPIDGVVVERYRVAGEYVENQPVVRIAQLDPLQVETILPMTLFGQVSAGMVAEVRAENAPETPHRAVVTVVDRLGDAASGTFGVRLSLANPDSRIPAGLKCKLAFLAGERAPVPARQVPALVLPDAVAEPSVPAPAAPETIAPVPAAPVVKADARRDVVPAVEGEDAIAPPAVAAIAPAPPGFAAAAVDAVDTLVPGNSCTSVGPLATADEARALARAFAAQGHAAWMARVDRPERIGFIVATPPQPDLESAERLAAKLGAAGIEHRQAMHTGVFVNRVSLGVYAGPGAAERRREGVTALGVEAEVLERTRIDEQWWVRARVAGSDTAQTEFVSLTGDLPVQSGGCDGDGVRSAGVPAAVGAAS